MAEHTKRRGSFLIMLLLALLAVAFAFIWVLTKDAQLVWRGASSVSSSSAAAPSGQPLQLRNAPATKPAETGTPRKPVPEAEAAEPSPETEPITEPLHQPDYGELLQRGGASAVFTLRDAQGAMLVDPPERVHLFRNLGKYWHIDQCEYVDGEIRCVGLSGTGLEPGEYELEIDAQRYGRLQHKFRVTRGQKLSGEIRTPYWRRIICLKFVDPDGQPVKWIHRWPRAEQPENEKYARQNHYSPPPAIHRPSRREQSRSDPRNGVEIIGESSMLDLDGFEQGPLATDDGCAYAVVYAGARTSLVTEFLESVWGTDGVTFEGTFESREWDERTVVLPATDLVAAHVAREGRKTYDPGRRSLLKPARVSGYSPAACGRLIVTLLGPATLAPRYRHIGHEDDEWYWYLDIRSFTPMTREGDQWVAQLYSPNPVELMVTDGQTFASVPELIDMAGQAEQHVVRHFSAVSLPRPEFRLPPTLNGFWVERSFLLAIHGEDTSADRTTAALTLHVDQGEGPLLFAEATLERVAKGQSAYVRLTLESAYGTGLFSQAQHDYMHLLWRGPFEELVSKLKAGEFHVTCDPAGAFVFRAVGDLGEGLPWVQSSIVPYEHDRAAATLRGLVPDIRAEGIDLLKLDGSSWMVRHVQWARTKAAKPGAASESYAQFLPERLAELVTDPGARYWLALNRAWYSMHNQVNTDEHGYAWSEDTGLEPGKLYVLYLWSQSCDDLQPDRRIVFKATEGVTDLGVIALPSYR